MINIENKRSESTWLMLDCVWLGESFFTLALINSLPALSFPGLLRSVSALRLCRWTLFASRLSCPKSQRKSLGRPSQCLSVPGTSWTSTLVSSFSLSHYPRPELAFNVLIRVRLGVILWRVVEWVISFTIWEVKASWVIIFWVSLSWAITSWLVMVFLGLIFWTTPF